MADPTNWFFTNKAAVDAILCGSGFAIEANPEREVYLCRKYGDRMKSNRRLAKGMGNPTSAYSVCSSPPIHVATN